MDTYPLRRKRSPASAERIAKGLGWVSLALGVAQIVAPRAIARLTGVPLPAPLTMLCGAREIACGIGLLTEDSPTEWMQARVAGDVIDLATIGGALVLPGLDKGRLAIATAAIGAVTAVDVYLARELARTARRIPRHVIASIHVDRPPEALYAFWRELTNLPRVMPHVESVRVIDERRSHWVAKGPAGTRVEWDAELIDDKRDSHIAWRSVDGSQVYNAGSVQFARSGAGTNLVVELLYDPPFGLFGAVTARLFGRSPEQELDADLAAFKRLMEGR